MDSNPALFRLSNTNISYPPSMRSCGVLAHWFMISAWMSGPSTTMQLHAEFSQTPLIFLRIFPACGFLAFCIRICISVFYTKTLQFIRLYVEVFSVFFTPSFLSCFTGFIDTFVQKCFERSTDRGYCDIVEHVASPLALTCALMLLGFPEAEWPQIGRWWNLRKAYSRTRQQYTSLFSELWSVDFDVYLRSKIDEKFHQPGDDVLSAIIQTRLDSAPLNEQEIIEFVILILVASQDTTAQLVANSVLCLLQYEKVRDRLSRDLGLLKPFLEEVLRYTSPVQGVSRVPTCDVAIDRAILHAGQEVIVWIGSANRDESIFERAAEFDLDRKPNPHLAFGMGIHYCLGAALSSLATQAVLRQLLQSFPHFQLANRPPLRWSSNPFLSGPAQLPLQLTE
nr:MAG: cytochrome P450 [Leptolyngbya sp. IPPAS B-1204]